MEKGQLARRGVVEIIRGETTSGPVGMQKDEGSLPASQIRVGCHPRSTLTRGKGSNEDVFVVNIPKENNPDDVRQTMAFGIDNRALQYLVLLVLRELVELHPSQYQTNPYGPRGTHPAIEQVKKALSEGYVWAIEYDIKDCYPSFNGKELSNFLPLPKKVIEAVLLCEHLNLKGGYSLYNHHVR